jgi:GNAT superfamily N-acetyltransferase
MNELKIVLVKTLSEKAETKMAAGLKAYAESHGVHVDYQPFALELLDEQGDAIGVLEAFSSYSCIHIQDLWVDEAHRGKGYGRQLIANGTKLR